MHHYLFFIWLIFFPGLSFNQETSLVENSISNTVIVIPLPEIGELKVKYVSTIISYEELFRLASFYLSEQLYHQASELYGHFIELNSQEENYVKRIPTAYYNRALALFSLQQYDSALLEFLNAYHYDDQLYESLRMAGTLYFLKKNKDKSLTLWQQYLQQNTTPSAEREAIEKAVALLSDPDFTFEEEKIEKEKDVFPNNSWPFLNPEIIPNPDSEYEKKRVV